LFYAEGAMLVVTVSRRDANGHSVPLLALNDPAIVRTVLRAVTHLASDGNDPGEQARIVTLPTKKEDLAEGSDE